MALPEDAVTVTTVEELHALVGEPSPRARDKVRPVLHPVDRAWIAASPFVLVATSDAAGRCTVSPKGDPAGAVLVIDESTVAIPDRPGNRRVDGWHDVLENPHVGLLFVVPGRGDTLRVDGRATLVREAAFLDDLVVDGHRPTLALVVEVERVLYHCSKAFLRSRLWDPQRWDPDAVPSRAHIAHALEPDGRSLDELEKYYGPSYGEGLYR